MKTLFLSAAALLALSACGSGAAVDGALNEVGAVVDGGALVETLNQSVDRQALEGVARGAVEGAVREALPTAEIEALGVVVDEKALVGGLGEAVDTQALGGALKGALGSGEAAPAE